MCSVRASPITSSPDDLSNGRLFFMVLIGSNSSEPSVRWPGVLPTSGSQSVGSEVLGFLPGSSFLATFGFVQPLYPGPTLRPGSPISRSLQTQKSPDFHRFSTKVHSVIFMILYDDLIVFPVNPGTAGSWTPSVASNNNSLWIPTIGLSRCFTQQFCVHQYYATTHSKLFCQFQNWKIQS